jgi:hypothetical protein
MGTVPRILEFYMGKNTPMRKDFIVKNLLVDVVSPSVRIDVASRA